MNPKTLAETVNYARVLGIEAICSCCKWKDAAKKELRNDL